MKTRKQRERILALLYNERAGLTRNQLNAITRQRRAEIPIQTLCSRLRELEEMGKVTVFEHAKCPVTGERNAVYRLTGATRGGMTRQREATA